MKRVFNLCWKFVVGSLIDVVIVWNICRAGAVVAKYGDKSVYFDLEDLGNTTGQWDVYGSDAPSPYNSLQVFHSINFYFSFGLME